MKLAARRLLVRLFDDTGSLADGFTRVMIGAFQSAPCRAAIGVVMVNGSAAVAQRLSGKPLPEAFCAAVTVYDVLAIGAGCLLLLSQIRRAGDSESS